jgi:hypothetical protein
MLVMGALALWRLAVVVALSFVTASNDFTLLFGTWGVLFAAPMTLVLILAVKTFSVEGAPARAAEPIQPRSEPVEQPHAARVL